MGICSSYESVATAAQTTETAKLILRDGRLQEFPYPIKASYILQKDPTSFICNSDDMEFDVRASAISADEELQLGQLYFALPLSRLRQPLQAEEMAALAVKASSALVKCGCRRPVLFSGDNVAPRRVVDVGDRRRRTTSRGGSGDFRASLGAIPE